MTRTLVALLAVLTTAVLLTGCACGRPVVSEFSSQDSMGYLDIHILAPEGMDPRPSRIYIDDMFVGSETNHTPMFRLPSGKHSIRVELDGTQTYKQEITILGPSNGQILNVPLQKK
ncbi:MAG: PEGA domain-containing protein [bacterium]